MTISKHHNHKYSSGIPLACGDRYYSQDLGRDFNYLQDKIGLILKDSVGQSKVIVSGGIVTQVTGQDKIDITALIAYAPYNVTIPDTFATIPPTTTTSDINLLRVNMGAVSAFNIAGTATLDGSTPNYVKVAYTDVNLNSRQRAKKTGTYYYELSPSYVLTCDATPPTIYQICLGVIVSAGSGVAMTITTSLKTSILKSTGVPLLSQTLGIPYKDQRNYKIKDITVGTQPWGVCFDGTYIWVANIGSDNVKKIDIVSYTVVATVTVGTTPQGICYGGGYVWTVNNGSANVSKIDIITNTVVDTIAVGTAPWGVCFDGTYIWVANAGSNSVKKIDIASDTVVATVAVGTAPHNVCFDGAYIWVTNYSSDSVKKIDIASNTVVATVTVGTGPDFICFDGQFIWVTNYTTSNVSKIEIIGNTVIATITVGTNPRGICFDEKYIWTCNYGTTTISKIDMITNTVIATVTVNNTPTGNCFDGRYIWITNNGSTNISKINI